jgi:RNA polymerase sigma-70 factor (ECF subfamily)
VSDEQSLIQSLKLRDPDALALIFEQYADKIYRLAVGLLHDEQQGDGVVQNTFLALIEHIDSFEGRAAIGTWLYRVAYNECMARLRSVKPNLELDDSASLKDENLMPSALMSWEDVPEQVFGSREAMDEMQRAIYSLPASLRAVFTLRDIEELSTRETADILGISEAAVKVRLHRARLTLREQLAGYFEERVRTA